MAQNAPITTGASDVQQAVADNPQQPETRRELSTATYTANSTSSIDIPRDTAIKRMNLAFSLAATATYASGAPVLSPLGFFQRVCPAFIVNADGSRNVKVLDLFMQRCIQAYAYGGMPRRGYQVGAGIQGTTLQPSTEWLSGTIAYGATTQDIIGYESIDVQFENNYAYSAGKTLSLLYTKNLSTCQAQFYWGSVNNIINDGNAAPVVYTNVAISVVPTIIEARDGTPGNGAFDFTETVIRKQFSSQTTSFNVDLNTGNRLLAIGLLAQNGDANKSLSDTCVTDLNLLVNGSTSLQKTNFKRLQNDGKGRRGLSDDQFGSNSNAGTHAQSGFAWMNLMKFGNAQSGVDTRLIAGVSQLQLQVSTAGTTGIDPATYTNPVQLSVLQQQLIPVPLKS